LKVKVSARLIIFCDRLALTSTIESGHRVLQSNLSVEPIAPSLEKIVASSLRRNPRADAAVMAWPLVCGSTVAARTRAVEFSGGVLRVEVPDGAWRAELQDLAPKYLAALNRYVTGVNRVEFLLPGKVQKATAAMQKSEIRMQK